MRPPIAFHGLGALGFPIAARLARVGHPIAAFDLDAQALERWRSAYPAATDGAEIVITCVTDEAALVALFEAELIAAARPGRIHIDHTTTAPATARRLGRELAKQGAFFLDVPVSGAVAGAQAGTLSAFVGADVAALEAARPVLAAYCGRITHLGDCGAGQLAKLCNQVAIAGTVRGLAEAVALARAGGLEVAPLLAALGAGSAASVQLEQHSSKLASEARFSDSFSWIYKDLQLALQEAREKDVALLATTLIAHLLRR